MKYGVIVLEIPCVIDLGIRRVDLLHVPVTLRQVSFG
jgi:hypothetical protein